MRPCLTSRRFDVVVATERTCFKRSRQAAASGGTRKRDPSRRLDTVRRALGATSRHTLHGLQLLLNPDPRISCRLGGGHGPESVRSSGLVTGRRAPATSRGRAVTHCSNGHVESDSWGGGGGGNVATRANSASPHGGRPCWPPRVVQRQRWHWPRKVSSKPSRVRRAEAERTRQFDPAQWLPPRLVCRAPPCPSPSGRPRRAGCRLRLHLLHLRLRPEGRLRRVWVLTGRAPVLVGC